MSAPANCNPCCSTNTTTQIPGPEGPDGTPGSAGVDGQNAFTLTTADFVIPAEGANVTILVANSSWMAINQHVISSDGTHSANFQVVSLPSTSSVELQFLNYDGDSATGQTISSGAQVSPSGYKMTLSAALPTALTDNSGGTQSNTIASTVGIRTLAFYIEAATIANGDLLTEYVPGYKFKILKFDARCAKPVTTGAKASSLNLEINTTNLTGGVINLAGTYTLGAAQAGSAVTGNNTGSATDSFSIEASATTAFVEGGFWLLVTLQNLDDADAFASLSKHVNDLITALS